MTPAPVARVAARIAVFRLGDTRVAFDAEHVEVVPRPHGFSRVPGALAGVAGLVALRGGVVPVFDLGCRLGLAPVPTPARAPLAVLASPLGPVGFVADEAVGELDVSGLSIEPVGAGLRDLLGGVATGAYWLTSDGSGSTSAPMVVLLDAAATADWSPGS